MTGTTLDDPVDIRSRSWECVDGNEAAARVAYAFSEVIPIYPITPSSTMAELADEWATAGRRNLWGTVPEIVEMQSEAGAAGTLHGAVQKGAMATTFTASQGLLLMVPNMFKIAGELTPCVMHVAARTVATHALSIFGDHSDVMHCRTTGWAMLTAASVQEAHDFAAVAHAATLRARVPFVHFFDGFRTSHEVGKVNVLGDADLRALVDDGDVVSHRERGLTSDAPVVRGSAQNPDTFFQAREAANPHYEAVPGIVAEILDELAGRCGRRYGLVDYVGAPDADRVIVLMGSGAGAADEAVEALNAAGEHVGLLKVRLYRPFPTTAFVRALPPSVRSIAVLDRTKEPGATGEPLLLDVITTLHDAMDGAEPPLTRRPHIIGGRYGLASKEFRPAHAAAVFTELARFDAPHGAKGPRRRFTVGIHDDVSNLSLDTDDSFAVPRPEGEVHAVFFGLGSDGTVGANKASVKIIGEHTDLFAQGYFVYDSKKSGSVTVSHLRFGPQPIRSTYLIDEADLVACHQFGLLEKMDVLGCAKPGATLLLNSPYPADELWQRLPDRARAQIVEKRLEVWAVDATAVARDNGLGTRINTVMQPCFFALAGVIPVEEAIDRVKAEVTKSYGRRGSTIVERNFAAIDASLVSMTRMPAPPANAFAEIRTPDSAPTVADDFVARVTMRMLAGEGDLLPVSAFPVDGTFPTGTARLEKRAIAQDLPIWDADICIDCGKCTIACPHAAIRMKVFEPAALEGAPAAFKSKTFRSKDIGGYRMAIQVAPDDCTGCGVCVDVCPAKSKSEARHKSLNLEPALQTRDVERVSWEFFETVPHLDRDLLPHDSVKGSQALEPLFEFSGACAGCGETPYLKLVTQLFGDRMIVANATGCSSIYGGNLPTTPWSTNAEGRGPAWSNSLFEDNAEFGLGLRLGLDAEETLATTLLRSVADVGLVDGALADAVLDAEQSSEPAIRAQRERIEALRADLLPIADAGAEHGAAVSQLLAVIDSLVRKGIWIVGGDGWAYDIGFGGLDHVLASGRDVNILVLDTEVYSNTGGQASKSTPRGAVAKFAASGKPTAKKDLGAMARAYGNVYVAQIALGANDLQATKALIEAEAWPGPSLVIAYSTCIAHGIDMAKSLSHQKDAVRSGYWSLYRFRPTDDPHGTPFHLDSKEPSIPLTEFVASEARFGVLERTDPERASRLIELAQQDVDERWRYYRQLGGIERTVPHPSPDHDSETDGSPAAAREDE